MHKNENHPARPAAAGTPASGRPSERIAGMEPEVVTEGKGEEGSWVVNSATQFRNRMGGSWSMRSTERDPTGNRLERPVYANREMRDGKHHKKLSEKPRIIEICMTLCIVYLSLMPVCGVAQVDSTKIKIAVREFGNNSTFQWYGLGHNVSNMLITELVKSGRYAVIEWDLVKEGLTSADAFIFGAITEFGIRSSGTTISVPTLGGVGASIEKGTIRIVVDARVVSATTGQVVYTTKGEGEMFSTNISGIYQQYSASTGTDSFDQTEVGKAMRTAVCKIVLEIGANY